MFKIPFFYENGALGVNVFGYLDHVLFSRNSLPIKVEIGPFLRRLIITLTKMMLKELHSCMEYR